MHKEKIEIVTPVNDFQIINSLDDTRVAGYRNLREAQWNDISKGMPRGADARTDDEEQMRCYWREWETRRSSKCPARSSVRCSFQGTASI